MAHSLMRLKPIMMSAFLAPGSDPRLLRIAPIWNELVSTNDAGLRQLLCDAYMKAADMYASHCTGTSLSVLARLYNKRMTRVLREGKLAQVTLEDLFRGAALSETLPLLIGTSRTGGVTLTPAVVGAAIAGRISRGESEWTFEGVLDGSAKGPPLMNKGLELMYSPFAELSDGDKKFDTPE